MRRVIWLLTPTVVWVGGVIVSFQLLNVHEVNDDRQTEIHTVESLMPEPIAFEDEMAIEKLKKHINMYWLNSSITDLKQEIGLFILRSISFLIPFGIKRNFLSSGRSWLLYLFIRRMIKEIVVIIEAYHFCQLHNRILSSIFLWRLTP